MVVEANKNGGGSHFLAFLSGCVRLRGRGRVLCVCLHKQAFSQKQK
jgi:hypothetical protein